MDEEKIKTLEEKLAARKCKTINSLKKIERIRALCQSDLIPKPKGFWGRTCPECGKKLEIYDTGPVFCGKCSCGYEYVYEMSDVNFWMDKGWVLPEELCE